MCNYGLKYIKHVLYGYEIWSVIQRENRLRVFEKEVLRKIYGCKREEVTGRWRK
jgi:hypothetical protein